MLFLWNQWQGSRAGKQATINNAVKPRWGLGKGEQNATWLSHYFQGSADLIAERLWLFF